MHIKNKQDRCNIMVCSLFEPSCRYESSNFQTTYFSYTHSYMQADKNITL
jgi:hypothetical protein